MTPRLAALLLAVPLALLGPASAAPCAGTCLETGHTLDATLTGTHLHAEASVHVALTVAGIPILDETPGTGPVDADPACADPCTIAAAVTAYTPPVVVVATGTSVLWHSTDIGHVQRETSTPVGSPAGCFNVPVAGGGDSDPVRFDVSGGSLTATTGSTTSTCLNAVSVGGAAFAVPYHCTLHPNMNGVVVVTA